MGPTYLVLLMAGSAAIVVYEGHDEIDALKAFDAACEKHRGKIEGGGRVVRTTIRAEAVLP